ncbi:hypothetical protein ACT3TD_09765 [Corynebacterium sp. AOP36-E1-14]|uniref:hypothetical protein n=1 Tax=unclassified Corynebacterium TaxID=2624378 RepID=UPI004033BEE0
MTDLQATIDNATAPYIDPDAAPGTVQWAAAIAAQNLRDATRLFEDCLTDLGATE